jgi:cytidine diphosphoramidate kinase
VVIWLVGISGSGKTTIGREVYTLWKQKEAHTVFIDGDDIRKIFQTDREPKDYSLEGRFSNAKRIQHLCAFLDSQDINVVCAIQCLFDEVMKENRTLFSEYFQVFIDTRLETVRERDVKGLYKRALEGKESNVVGVHIPFPVPSESDLTIDTNPGAPPPQELARMTLSKSGIL